MNRKQRRTVEAQARQGKAPGKEVTADAPTLWMRIYNAEAASAAQILEPGVTPETVAATMDNAINFAMGFTDERTPVACSAGCYYCCHQKVGTTALEMVHLATEIRARYSPEVQAEFVEGLRKVVEQRGPEDSTPVRCNFLDEKDACRIYEIRPLACRSVTSTTSEPCRAWLEDGMATGKVADRRRYQGAQATMHGLDKGATALGYEGGYIDFHGALHHALSGEKVVADWYEGKRVFSAKTIPPRMRRLPVIG